MTPNQIKAIGNFLAYYHTDLNYIKRFHDFKNQKEHLSAYLNEGAGNFYSFLVEFRVIRNIPKDTCNKLLEETQNWVHGQNPDDVDGFAKLVKTKGLTRDKVMASMASKILFLNNPWKILPMDSLARKTLNQKSNIYSEYRFNLEKFSIDELESIQSSLNSIDLFANKIELDYQGSIDDLYLIRRNRIIDKILWTSGKR